MRMIGDFKFGAAVFVGGMEGIVDEYKIFKKMHPNAKIVALYSPGGMARTVFDMEEGDEAEKIAFDFTGILYRALNISTTEVRTSQGD